MRALNESEYIDCRGSLSAPSSSSESTDDFTVSAMISKAPEPWLRYRHFLFKAWLLLINQFEIKISKRYDISEYLSLIKSIFFSIVEALNLGESRFTILALCWEATWASISVESVDNCSIQTTCHILAYSHTSTYGHIREQEPLDHFFFFLFWR